MNTSISVERVDDSGSCYRSGSSTGSFTSYATLPNVDYNSEVLSTCDNDGQKLVQDSSLSLENNAASTATLAYAGVNNNKKNKNSKTMCSLYSSDDDDDEDCDRDSSSSSSTASSMEDKDKSSCSDFSMEDCTIVDDTSFKRSTTKNEAELMFLQVVEILRFEKKVNHPGNVVQLGLNANFQPTRQLARRSSTLLPFASPSL